MKTIYRPGCKWEHELDEHVARIAAEIKKETGFSIDSIEFYRDNVDGYVVMKSDEWFCKMILRGF